MAKWKGWAVQAGRGALNPAIGVAVLLTLWGCELDNRVLTLRGVAGGGSAGQAGNAGVGNGGNGGALGGAAGSPNTGGTLGGTLPTGGKPGTGQGGTQPTGGKLGTAGTGQSGVGGGGTAGTGAGALPPAVAVRLSYATKQIQFTWDAAPGATFYKLMGSTDGTFQQTGADLTGLSHTLEIAVHRLEWEKMRYRVDACNAQGCTPGAEVNTQGASAWAIGYLKASTPKADAWFGTAVALSRDGKTLAVGAVGEDSNTGTVYVFIQGAAGTWSEQSRLKASNAKAGAYFGSSVALSADGNTLTVGAMYEDSGSSGVGGNQAHDCDATPTVNCANGSGAVYVFTRANSAWQQQVYLKASNTKAGAQFGTNLALSGDGNTLAVGGHHEGSAASGVGGNQNHDCEATPAVNCATNSGAVYVFTRTNAAWQQQVYLKASNTKEEAGFGSSLALSGEGNTLVVGAYAEGGSVTGANGNQNHDCGAMPPINCANGSGAVYVFTRTNTTWQQQAYLKASNTKEGANFGASLALSADGNILAAGAAGEDSAASGVGGNQNHDCSGSNPTHCAKDSGAVYVFTRSVARWGQTAYVKASNTGTRDRFGESVAMSGDGNTLVVGASGEASGSSNPNDNSAPVAGAVYLY